MFTERLSSTTGADFMVFPYESPVPYTLAVLENYGVMAFTTNFVNTFSQINSDKWHNVGSWDKRLAYLHLNIDNLILELQTYDSNFTAFFSNRIVDHHLFLEDGCLSNKKQLYNNYIWLGKQEQAKLLIKKKVSGLIMYIDSF